MADAREFPVGYRFNPTDEELVEFYLLKKLRGEPLPYNGVEEKDLYATEPWNVFSENERQPFYVFVKLKKVNPTGRKNNQRMAGSGTWAAQTHDSIEDRNGLEIGKKRMLSFKYSKTTIGDKGNWIMYELSVPQSDDIVVCQIRNRALEIGDNNNNKNNNNKRPNKRVRNSSVVINANPVFSGPPRGDNNVVPKPEPYGHIYVPASNMVSMNCTDIVQFGSINQGRNFCFKDSSSNSVGNQPALLTNVAASNNENKLIESYDPRKIQEYPNNSSFTKNGTFGGVESLGGERQPALLMNVGASNGSGGLEEIYHDSLKSTQENQNLSFTNNGSFFGVQPLVGGQQLGPLTDVAASNGEYCDSLKIEDYQNFSSTNTGSLGIVINGEQHEPLTNIVAATNDEGKLENGQISYSHMLNGDCSNQHLDTILSGFFSSYNPKL